MWEGERKFDFVSHMGWNWNTASEHKSTGKLKTLKFLN